MTDTMSMLAVIISCFTLAFSVYSAFLNKKLEIKQRLFHDVLIGGLDKISDEFIKDLEDSDKISTSANNLSSDIDEYLLSLESIYLNFQLKSLIVLKEEYTDWVFENLETDVESLVGRFDKFIMQFKIRLYEEVESQFSFSFMILKYSDRRTWQKMQNSYARFKIMQ